MRKANLVCHPEFLRAVDSKQWVCGSFWWAAKLTSHMWLCVTRIKQPVTLGGGAQLPYTIRDTIAAGKIKTF